MRSPRANRPKSFCSPERPWHPPASTSSTAPCATASKRPAWSSRAPKSWRSPAALAAAGIPELEAGTPAIDEEERADLDAIAGLGLGCRITAWCRATAQDLQHAGSCAVDSVHISFPVSLILFGAFGKEERWLWKTLPEIVGSARARFRHVSVGAQDASRADASLLDRFVLAARDAGVCRVRVADTVGIWNPHQTGSCFRRLRAIAGAGSRSNFTDTTIWAWPPPTRFPQLKAAPMPPVSR